MSHAKGKPLYTRCANTHNFTALHTLGAERDRHALAKLKCIKYIRHN